MRNKYNTAKAFYCDTHQCDFTGFTTMYCAKCVAEQEALAATGQKDEADFGDIWQDVKPGEGWHKQIDQMYQNLGLPSLSPPSHGVISQKNIPAPCPIKSWTSFSRPVIHQVPNNSSPATPVALPTRPIPSYDADIIAYDGSDQDIYGHIWYKFDADVVDRNTGLMGTAPQESILLIRVADMVGQVQDYAGKYMEFVGAVSPAGSLAGSSYGLKPRIYAVPVYFVAKHRII